MGWHKDYENESLEVYVCDKCTNPMHTIIRLKTPVIVEYSEDYKKNYKARLKNDKRKLQSCKNKK